MAFHTGDKNHNYFYRITNQINWKYYFGIHSTNDLDDGYMGSSKLIKESIKKYGKENFVKTIIADYSTRKEASDHEKLAVTMIQVEDVMCYNVKTGGDNEFVWVPTDEMRQKCRISSKSKILPPEFVKNIGGFKGLFGNAHPLFGKPVSNQTRVKMSKASKGKKKTKDHAENISKGLLGHEVLPETREKIRQTLTGKFVGENSPSFGIVRSDEWKKRHHETRKRRKLLINGQIFESVVDAANSFKVSENTIRDRVKSTRRRWEGWQDYPFVNEK